MQTNYNVQTYSKTPSDPNIKIWRYMDFSKFVSLLSSKSLYFSRCDLLGDKFEGSYPKKLVDSRPAIFKEIIDKYNEKKLCVRYASSDKKMSFLDSMSYMYEWQRKWTYVNCWHMNEHESAALWKLYSSSCDVVAIQSRYYLLKNNLPEEPAIGEVIYIDYEDCNIPNGNCFWPYYYKRISFSHEKELRAIYMEFPLNNNWVDVGKENNDFGRYVPVDINKLIENVYVGPSSSDWFKNVVENVMEKYQLIKPLFSSKLEGSPLF